MKPLFRHILVPHDFSTHATRALGLAAELARKHRGRLTVLHVVVPFQPMMGFPGDAPVWVPDTEMASEARQHLEKLVQRTLGRRRTRATCKVLVGNPVDRIVDAARGHDVIVMTTAGRSGLAHLVIGSVAEKVVRHSPIPVLTLRPAGGGRRRRRS